MGSRLVYRNRGRFSSHYRADKGRSRRSSTLEAISPLSGCVTLDGYAVGKITWIHDACPATALESVGVEPDAFPKFSDWFNQFEAAFTHTDEQEGGDRKSNGGYHTLESATAELLGAVK